MHHRLSPLIGGPTCVAHCSHTNDRGPLSAVKMFFATRLTYDANGKAWWLSITAPGASRRARSAAETGSPTRDLLQGPAHRTADGCASAARTARTNAPMRAASLSPRRGAPSAARSSTPDETSTPRGATVRITSPTFAASSPPETINRTARRVRRSAVSLPQSNEWPVPPGRSPTRCASNRMPAASS